MRRARSIGSGQCIDGASRWQTCAVLGSALIWFFGGHYPVLPLPLDLIDFPNAALFHQGNVKAPAHVTLAGQKHPSGGFRPPDLTIADGDIFRPKVIKILRI